METLFIAHTIGSSIPRSRASREHAGTMSPIRWLPDTSTLSPLLPAIGVSQCTENRVGYRKVSGEHEIGISGQAGLAPGCAGPRGRRKHALRWPPMAGFYEKIRHHPSFKTALIRG